MRGDLVTGVQACALPICLRRRRREHGLRGVGVLGDRRGQRVKQFRRYAAVEAHLLPFRLPCRTAPSGTASFTRQRRVPRPLVAVEPAEQRAVRACRERLTVMRAGLRGLRQVELPLLRGLLTDVEQLIPGHWSAAVWLRGLSRLPSLAPA